MFACKISKNLFAGIEKVSAVKWLDSEAPPTEWYPDKDTLAKCFGYVAITNEESYGDRSGEYTLACGDPYYLDFIILTEHQFIQVCEHLVPKG